LNLKTPTAWDLLLLATAVVEAAAIHLAAATVPLLEAGSLPVALMVLVPEVVTVLAEAVLRV
jgi:hypothetical protein